MKKLAIIVSLCIFAQYAAAALVTESDSYSGTTNYQETLNVPQFNGSLGTLDAVTLTFQCQVTGEAGYENTSSSAYDPAFYAGFGLESKIDLSIEYSISQGASDYLSGTDTGTSYTSYLEAYDGVTDYAGDSGKTDAYFNETYTAQITITDPAQLSAFVGTGTVDYLTAVNASVLMQLYGISSSSVSTQGTSTVTADYSYTVPEPATLALLGLGAFVLRKRK